MLYNEKKIITIIFPEWMKMIYAGVSLLSIVEFLFFGLCQVLGPNHEPHGEVAQIRTMRVTKFHSR